MVNRIGNIASNALNAIQSGFKSLFSRSVQDQGAMVSPKMTASNSPATAKTGSASSLVGPSTNSMDKNVEATVRQTFSEIAQSEKQIEKLPIEKFSDGQRDTMSRINKIIGRGLMNDKIKYDPNNLMNAADELNTCYEKSGMTKTEFLNLCYQTASHQLMNNDSSYMHVINLFKISE